jgi:uncharacterized phage protein (predicted DNA packaging)
MSYLTLAELKTHLRLNGNAEDGPLQVYIDATEDAFKSLSGKTLDTNATTGFTGGVPAAVKLALMLLASHFYRVREAYTAQDVAAMPFGFVSVCRRYSTKFVSSGVI